MSLTTFAAGVLALASATTAGPTESSQALFERSAESAHAGFGSEMLRLSDLDGDGVRDLAVAALGRAQVLILSGADGETLLALGGPAGFGHGLAAADLDGDGVDELVVAAPYASSEASHAGALLVHSATDGRLLAHVRGRVLEGHLGELLLTPGDLDGDGREELLVSEGGVPRLFDLSSGEMRAPERLLADAVGELLALRAQGVPARGLFVDDLDGDARREFVLARPWGAADGGGEVVVRASSDGRTLVRLASVNPGDGFGWALASVDDLDGDGRRDLVVGAPSDDEAGADAGAAYVVSGRTGSPLFALRGDRAGARLGAALAALDDVDGDGQPDVLAAAQDDDGRTRLLAFATPLVPVGGVGRRAVFGDRLR